MNRLPLAASIVWFSSMLVMVPATAKQAPIASKAELTRYLQDTPPGISPLDRLSPGGRKRFLAQLDFGDHGLRNLSLDDSQNELTHQQVTQLLALFGAEKYAPGEGLTPSEQSRRERERAMDAVSRKCVVATCPESEIERRYDELVLRKPDFSMSDAKRAELSMQDYDRLFSNHQLPEHIRSISHPDLRLLKRAADEAVFYAPDTTHVAQLEWDLAEMQRRNMTDDKDYASLHQILLTTRQFAEADVLSRQHPGAGADIVPILHKNATLHHGWPTALTVSKQGKTMAREAFDLSTPLRIVVVASCHFSQDAARAIAADAQLRPLFANHAIWLASQRESFSSVTNWNREFPDQPIHIAWQNSEWSKLDSWAMPTFYVFRHGHLIKKFSGWYDVKTLKHSLRDTGVLR